MKKVVVFGGSGFLGSYVVDELVERGYDVVVADLSKSLFVHGSATFWKCNILDIASVREALENHKPKIVYNFAALAAIDEACDKPVETMSLNVMGNLNILECCRELGMERFVYASSAYAVNTKGSFYGISKHTSEKLIEEYERRYSLGFTIIRYGSLYGERADGSNYIYAVLKRAIEEKKLTLKGAGDEEREYIHAIDAARLSVDVIESERYKNEHIILTGVEKLKRKDLLEMIKEILNHSVEIEQVEKSQEGHYKITPYEFHPYMAKKLVANPYIDMGQGIVECVKSIYDELGREYESE
jgi:UDP-glucose 4-epimerase